MTSLAGVSPIPTRQVEAPPATACSPSPEDAYQLKAMRLQAEVRIVKAQIEEVKKTLRALQHKRQRLQARATMWSKWRFDRKFRENVRKASAALRADEVREAARRRNIAKAMTKLPKFTEEQATVYRKLRYALKYSRQDAVEQALSLGSRQVREQDHRAPRPEVPQQGGSRSLGPAGAAGEAGNHP